MKRPMYLILGGVLVAILAVWLLFRRGGAEHVVLDLVDQFPSATQRKPAPETFSIVEPTIDKVKMRGIFTKDPSRLVYTITVPDNAEVRMSLALLEEAWTIPGDGVLFRVLATPANGRQEELLNVDLNPFANAADRGWHPFAVDLSEFAGEKIDLFFNTNASPPSRPQRDDHNGDLAVWGALRIVTH